MTDRPRVRDVRKDPPERVKRIVAEKEVARLMGLEWSPDLFKYDHHPALGIREWDPAAKDFIPPQHDTDTIFIRTSAAHRTKTSGRKGEKRSTSYGSDQHAIAKLDRLVRRNERPVPIPADGLDPGTPITWDDITLRLEGKPWPKRKIPSRPFAKDHRPLQSRNDLKGRQK